MTIGSFNTESLCQSGRWLVKAKQVFMKDSERLFASTEQLEKREAMYKQCPPVDNLTSFNLMSDLAGCDVGIK